MIDLLSVIVPCRNEAAFIEAFCASLTAQKLPSGWSLEVLVADGQSDDGTRARLEALAAHEPRIRVIDNPLRIVSTGLNSALAQSRGAVIARLDVHTEYASDYLAQCLAALADTGADNVGGPWRANAEAGRPTQEAIAAAFQSRWLAGGAWSRQLDYSGWVDTVYLGCWPRRVFERFGGFDETLVRNQDDEHNLRIVLGGGKIWQSARIISSYRPRCSLRALFHQYLQYGYWKPFVIRKHGQPASLRHLVPGVFLMCLVVLVTAALLGGPIWPLTLLSGVYGAVVTCGALLIAADSKWRLLPLLPAVIVVFHAGYGLGSLLGWLDVLTGAKTGRRRFARITR
jgi:glycosyltransferase involved in cell wall biosynthesis